MRLDKHGPQAPLWAPGSPTAHKERRPHGRTSCAQTAALTGPFTALLSAPSAQNGFCQPTPSSAAIPCDSLSRRGSSRTSSGRATPSERETPAEPSVFQALVTMYGASFPLGRTTFLRAVTGLCSCLRCTIQQHAGYEINRCYASAETSPYHSH